MGRHMFVFVCVHMCVVVYMRACMSRHPSFWMCVLLSALHMYVDVYKLVVYQRFCLPEIGCRL